MAKFNHRADPADSVVVLGLGRFGSALSQELEGMGVEVLGIDSNPTIVQEHADLLSQAVCADITSEEALSQLGVPEFECAVVAVGHNLEASILATTNCLSFGIPTVWAKASNARQGRILEQLGAHHVVYPESDTGIRTAHLIGSSMLDYQAYSDGFVMFTALTPPALTGKPLCETKFRKTYGLNVVAIRRPGGHWVHAEGDEVLSEDDLIIVTGPRDAAERFTQLK